MSEVQGAVRVVLVAVVLAVVSAGALGQQANPKELCEALYGADIQRVRKTYDTDDDVKLARQMLEGAEAMANKPALQAEICRQAHSLIEKNPKGSDVAKHALRKMLQYDPNAAVEAYDGLASLWQREFAKRSGFDKAVAGELATDLLVLKSRALAGRNEYVEAQQALRRARGIAMRVKSPLIKQLKTLKELYAERLRTMRSVDILRNRLRRSPDDHVIREKLVVACLTELDNPAEAARHLSNDLDEVYTTYVPLARKDVDKLSKALCHQLGQWYYELGSEASGAGKRNAWLRARNYFRRYLSLQTEESLQRTKAKLILSRIERDLGDNPEAELGVDPYPEVSREVQAFARVRNRLPAREQAQITTAKLKEVNGLEVIHIRWDFSRGHKSIRGVTIWRTRQLKTISPLMGMKMGYLRLRDSRKLTGNLNMLKGMRLNSLELGNLGISSLKGIEDLPLKRLRIDNCPNLTTSFTTAPETEMDDVTLWALPKLESLGGLTEGSLRKLNLSDCRSLTTKLTRLPTRKIESLTINACPDVEMTSTANLPALKHLRLENITDANGLAYLKGSQLESLRLVNVGGVKDLSALADMKSLTNLQIHGCPDLVSLKGIEGLPITYLELGRNPKLASDPDFLAKLPKLNDVYLFQWDEVESLEWASKLALKRLRLSGLHNLTGDLTDLRSKKLGDLYLRDLPKLTGLDGIERLSLRSVTIHHVPKVPEEDFMLLKKVSTLRRLRTDNRARDRKILPRRR